MKTLAWLLVPCLAANAVGVAPPSVTSAADAPALVRQLGADAYETRERASRLLAFLGKASVPALREGRKGRDAEVRRRCTRLLAQFDRPALEPRLQALIDGKDTFTPPLPGWGKFRELAGADVAARLLYVEVYKADRVVLEWVQGGCDPAVRIDHRWESALNKRITEVQAKAATDSGVGEIALGLLLAMSIPKDDKTSGYDTSRPLYRPVVYRHLRADPAFRRLVVQFFAGPGAHPFGLYTSADQARDLGLEDVRDDILKPAALRLLDGALAPTPDFEKLLRVAAAIEELGIQKEVPERVRKAIRKRAREVGAKPFDKKRTPEIVSILKHLGMQETLTAVFEPVAEQLIRRLDEEMFSRNHFDDIHELCKSVNKPKLTDALDTAACKLLTKLGTKEDQFRSIDEAIELTNLLHLTEAREGLLIPAVRKRLLAALEDPDALEPLMYACDLALRVKVDRVAELVKPALHRHAKSLQGTPSQITTIVRVHHLARSLDATDEIDEQIKRVLRKALVKAVGQELGESEAHMGLMLARELRLKEGVELALEAASNRKYRGQVRGDAALTVGWLGTPEQAKRLAPVLEDLSDAGYSVNVGVGMRTVLVCDVALAAQVACAKQNLQAFGFDKGATFTGDSGQGKLCGFGFRTHKDRSSAIARWKKWSAAQKK